MGWSEESTQLVRLRGDDLDGVRQSLFPGRRLIILSRDAASPAAVAQLLTEAGYGDSMITVLGNLDTETESRIEVPARDWAVSAPALNVVCVTCVGQGPVADRAQEHLGRSDTGIILFRKIWERELRALAEGRPLKKWCLPQDAEIAFQQESTKLLQSAPG
jgi:precorrin-6Y C5,15-methyltransferase (decarboxylating)